MGTKDLFDKGTPFKILTSTDVQKATEKVESPRNLRAKIEEKGRFIPQIDYNNPAEFVRFGSAEKYYEDAFDRITDNFPYDGSEAEQVEFYNSSSYLDLYVFDKEYPRTTGYATIHSEGYTAAGVQDGWVRVHPLDQEYIIIKGGPHTASGGMPSGSLGTQFTGANYYNTDIYTTDREYQGTRTGTRLSNLRYSLSDGVSVEFWLKKDGWQTTSTDTINKTAIFDLWNGEVTGTAVGSSVYDHSQYGRLLIYLSASGPVGTGTGGLYPFGVHLASGSTVWDLQFGANITTSSMDGDWHHFAFTFQSSSDNSSLEAKFFHSGAYVEASSSGDIGTFGEVTGSLVAHLGSLQTTPSGNAFAAYAYPVTTWKGYGGLKASMDEFRYWKTTRTAEDIGLNYFRQVRGGTNTDPANADLGVYYKFNEGITGTSSTDSIVLDYSGRISNGTWFGYPGSAARNTGSAMVSASAILEEWEDPIIRPNNTTLSNKRSSLIESGSIFDDTHNATLYNRIPSWIIEEDPGTLKDMMQIMASYMDTLHLQLESLPHLKDMTYASSSVKALPMSNRLVNNWGLEAPEIFAEADILAQIMSRDEVRNFDLNLDEIKNRIYKNIYNNLVYIYKSKGTLKSFRNLIRCYGVGDDIVRLNLYANNATHKIRDNYEPSAVRKNYVNFNHPDSFNGVVTQQSQSSNPSANNVSYVSGTVNEYLATTAELDVIFPKKTSDAGSISWFDTNFLSSSIFGTHRLLIDGEVNEPAFEQAAVVDDYSWSLYAVRPEENSSDAYLVFKSNRGAKPDFYLTSAIYPDLYDNERWNFAVRTKNVKYPVSDGASGSDAGNSTDFDIDDTYLKLELYGVNYDAGLLKNELLLTSSALTASAYLTADRRYYVGASRTNWTGSVNVRSDINAASLRHWESYLADEAVQAHGRDPNNFGSLRPYRSTYLMQSALTGTWVPQMATLALNWNFNDVTGSDSSGEFIVQDASSGSMDDLGRYHDNENNPQYCRTISYQYPGTAYGMRTSSTGAVDRAYIYGLRQNAPDSLMSSDMVNILSRQDDIEFTRETRPINYYFSFEKSMYGTITQEMMNFFGSVVEFNDLIGDPKNRYRQDYKELGKLRELFFEKIGNTPDLDKYVEYYKWIDNSLGVMLRQLVPATADFSDGIRTMVESHALERNKYWNKFPTLEMKVSDPEAAVHGITELRYDWEHGHAPPAPIRAVATGGTDILLMPGDQANNDRFKVNIPTHLGGTGEDITIRFVTATPSDGTAGEIQISLGGAETTRNRLVAAINGVDTSVVKYGAGSGDVTNGIAGISGANGSTVAKTTITSTQSSPYGGTSIVFTDIEGTAVAEGATGASPAYMTVPTTALESDNCLWWHDRAERTTGVLSSSVASVNTDRDAILTITETYRTGSPGPTLAQSTKALPAPTYQGSTYALRRFDEIYNLVPDESPLYHGGPDYSQRKRYGFVKPHLNSVSVATAHAGFDLQVIGQSTIAGRLDPEDGKDCDDALIPPELNKKKIKSGFYAAPPSVAAPRPLRTNPYTSQGYSDIVTPFSLYSSSVNTGYMAADIGNRPGATGGRKTLADVVSGGITNYHHDIIGNDMDVPMQGPFTEKYVGGNQWRHQDLVYDPETTGSAYDGNRAEAWYLIAAATNHLFLENVRSRLYHTVPRVYLRSPQAIYTREEAAKRPVNIRNIQMTASAVGAYKTTLPSDAGTNIGPTPTEFISGTLRSNIGNFENFYDIVQTSGRSINNVALTKQDGFSKTAIAPDTSAGSYVETLVSTEKPQRGKNEHVFVERFSAPGGPETAGDANGGFGLDFESAVYSPYNAMPWRNTSVRTPLNRTLLVNHSNQFGFYSNEQEIKNGGRVSVASTGTDIITNPGDQANNDRFTVNIPTALGGTGVDITIRVVTATPSDGTPNEIQVSLGGAETTRNRIVAAINGVDTSVVKYGAGSGDITNGVAGISAANGSTTADITITSTTGGLTGDTITFTDVEGTMISGAGTGASPATMVVPSGVNGDSTVTAENYSGTGSYQKANRNTLKTPRLSATSLDYGTDEGDMVVSTASVYDNGWVTHEIPRMETSYAWIATSYTGSLAFGHGHPDGLLSTSAGYVASIDFVSSSDFVSYIHPAIRTYGADHINVGVGALSPVFQTTHLNTNIVEPMTASQAILGHQIKTSSIGTTTPLTTYINIGDIDTTVPPAGLLISTNDTFIENVGAATTAGNTTFASAFMDLIIHRQGYYGHPSWKQIRGAEHQLTRYYRNNNQITINPDDGASFEVATKGGGTITIVPRFGELQIFDEPPVNQSSKPLKFVLGIETQTGINPDGTPAMGVKNLEINSSYGNDLMRFSNLGLEELTTLSSNTIYTSYDTIKNTYLNGALASPTTPVKSFVSLTYKQQVYPAGYNAGLEKVRERQNFKIKFWANSRADRTLLGNEKSSSMGFPRKLAGTTNWGQQTRLSQSAWVMDASQTFVDGPICSASNATSSASGELQNDYVMVHSGGVGAPSYRGVAFVKAGALYSRKHMLPSTASTVPVTLDNPQTGGLGSNLTMTKGAVKLFAGNALWEADRLAGRIKKKFINMKSPWGKTVAPEIAQVFESAVRQPIDPDYESNMKDAILQNQTFSVIPEFRISDHIKFYVESGVNFLRENNNFLDIYGASGSLPSSSGEDNFYKIYTNSDFMKNFETIHDDHAGFKSPSKITLKCKAIKKFLPYDGFYPAQRSLDMASQFSQSYGQYVSYPDVDSIKATSIKDYAEQARLRPLMAPLFAPGVMYNTIKSGMAVDYGTYSGSYEVICNTGSAGGGGEGTGGGGEMYLVGAPTALDGSKRRSEDAGVYAYGFDNRVPFEALVEPENHIANMTFVDMEPHPSASMNLSASWDGTGDPFYKLMANNFFAECIHMFMPNGQMTSFVSAKEDEFLPFEPGKVYGMRIKLRKSYNRQRTYEQTAQKLNYPIPQITPNEAGLMEGTNAPDERLLETFTMYSRPSAFGPPMAGRIFGPANQIEQDMGMIKGGPIDGYNPAYTPPYYCGEAWFDIYFKATDVSHDIAEILGDSHFSPYRFDYQWWTRAAGGGAAATRSDPAIPYDYQQITNYIMQLTASINIDGVANVNSVEYSPDGTPVLVSDSPVGTENVWVIEPKFETPMFNFTPTSGALRPITEADGNLTIPANGAATVPRGMWHQFGLPPSSDEEGIFLEVTDIDPQWAKNRAARVNSSTSEGQLWYSSELNSQGKTYLSLKNQIGMSQTSKRMGEVRESLEVREAIVAVPFTVGGDGSRQFFAIPSDSIDAYHQMTDFPAMAGALETSGNPELDIGDSIKKQIEAMKRYVIPPQFNFNDLDVDPVVMYIFEFSHIFDKDDLSYIWQNLPPKAAEKIEMVEAEISHPLLVNELMGARGAATGAALQAELQWMVFKVKQKAHTEYKDRLAKNTGLVGDTDISTFVLGGKKATLSPSNMKYSYNWPYDYFSLLEFGSIESEVEFGSTPEVPNISYLPEPTDEELEDEDTTDIGFGD